MGQTKFQKFIFTLMMCFFMVLGMTTYNIILNEASPSNSRIDGVTISKISPSVKGKYYG